MNERLKKLRAALGLSQVDFADRVCISRSLISNMESGERKMRDIHISQICVAFNVNEIWLRTGEGTMFVESDKTVLDELSREYGLDSVEKAIVETFITLPEGYREGVKRYFISLLHAVQDGDGYEEFRKLYIDQFHQPFAARNGANGDGLKNIADLIDESDDSPE